METHRDVGTRSKARATADWAEGIRTGLRCPNRPLSCCWPLPVALLPFVRFGNDAPAKLAEDRGIVPRLLSALYPVPPERLEGFQKVPRKKSVPPCPACGVATHVVAFRRLSAVVEYYRCQKCGHTWAVHKHDPTSSTTTRRCRESGSYLSNTNGRRLNSLDTTFYFHASNRHTHRIINPRRMPSMPNVELT